MKARKPDRSIDGYMGGMAKLNRRELIAMLAGFTASLTVSGCFQWQEQDCRCRLLRQTR